MHTCTDKQQGPLLLIGGEEDKSDEMTILSAFLEACGECPNIAIIATASPRLEKGAIYKNCFQQLGTTQAEILPLTNREDAENKGVLQQLMQADGIFITGGNPLRLSQSISSTASSRLILQKNASGTPIAGSSAGAMFLGEQMIICKHSEQIPARLDFSRLGGLGLLRQTIIDPHFSQRQRYERLQHALLQSKLKMAIGLDENSALLLTPQSKGRIIGKATVTIMDTSHAGRRVHSRVYRPGSSLNL